MKPNPPRAQEGTAGFTRLELLVTLATLALLGAVLHPAWGDHRPSRSLVCMDNLRRLQAAWLMYAEDSQGKLPSNYHGGFLPSPTGLERPWASGWLDWTTSSHITNTTYLTSAPYASLGLYLGGETSLHKCPADNYVSAAQARSGWTARVRSYSMNCYVGEGNQQSGPISTGYLIVKRLSDFNSLSPQQTFVFTEEHPDSINDSAIFVSMGEWRWLDLPASCHESSGWFAMADGHLQRHSWQSRTTLRSVSTVNYFLGTTIAANDPDLAWVRAHTTAR